MQCPVLLCVVMFRCALYCFVLPGPLPEWVGVTQNRPALPRQGGKKGKHNAQLEEPHPLDRRQPRHPTRDELRERQPQSTWIRRSIPTKTMRPPSARKRLVRHSRTPGTWMMWTWPGMARSQSISQLSIALIDAAGLTHSESMKAYLIMMGVRLPEMKRVLKPTGSIYTAL